MKKSLVLPLMIFGCLALNGCSKDQILGHYNQAIQLAGSTELTKNYQLTGQRETGIDDYTGTYTANYEDASTTEYIFGGTAIERAAGKDITITCTLTVTDGTAKVFWLSGSNEPIVLMEGSGTYIEELTLPDGGNYFGIEGEGFTGRVEMRIE
ncbi:hypothetical protein JZO70_05325 [Enterococcus sp. 669A]|uniref:Lipoprotein n=1 Tax=Candidatus Enterococcus moelleringii TaxID=2815325 RepID=A0ABS3LAX3_9ENTE|nr:hypothetical protein [Enterococcus sp. 669A]MBO1305569.1 hypothetical protein [Enterococcus sp. 669A]